MVSLEIAYISLGENYNEGILDEPLQQKVLEGVLANPVQCGDGLCVSVTTTGVVAVWIFGDGVVTWSFPTYTRGRIRCRMKHSRSTECTAGKGNFLVCGAS